jgi:hypothetical protein
MRVAAARMAWASVSMTRRAACSVLTGTDTLALL